MVQCFLTCCAASDTKMHADNSPDRRGSGGDVPGSESRAPSVEKQAFRTAEYPDPRLAHQDSPGRAQLWASKASHLVTRSPSQSLVSWVTGGVESPPQMAGHARHLPACWLLPSGASVRLKEVPTLMLRAWVPLTVRAGGPVGHGPKGAGGKGGSAASGAFLVFRFLV